MKILIVGCGKVGRNIAEELSKEKHELVLVDSNPSIVQEASTSLDIIGVIGDAASLSTLKEAGVEKADILLAITSSDEVNMLCCLFARKANPSIKTIARVRNPIYSDEINYIKDELGLTLIINPEKATASEIARIIRFPAAMKVEHFSRGRVELVSFSVPEGNALANTKISDISKVSNIKVIVVGIERGDEAFIPHGNDVIMPHDKVSIIALPSDITKFFSNVGILQNPIKTVMVVGGSDIAFYLTQQLEHNNIAVKIIDKDKERCEELADKLDNAVIVYGDASDNSTLIEEGVGTTDAFVSLTNVDEENVMLSLYATSSTDAKVVTKLNRIAFDSVIANLDLGSVVYPKRITADNILKYVRGLSASNSSNITSLYRILNNKGEALTFKVKKESAITNVPLKDLSFIDNLIICSIIRNDNVITPTGNDEIKVGDIVLIATTNTGIDAIEGIIK